MDLKPLFLACLIGAAAERGLAEPSNDSKFETEAKEKSPSFQLRKWTGAQASNESRIEYDYVGRASHNLGNGQNLGIDENYFDVRHQIMRHTLLAFLVQGGMEYQHIGFGVPNAALVPDRLDTLDIEIALDTRWSDKDLLHIDGRPGFYTDFRGAGWNAFNSPLDVGYTRVVSNTLQVVLGFSYNKWRSTHVLGAAGFRWQMDPRWKLKFYLPTPAIEYAARPDLTLSFGADIRGDSYRVGPHFGEAKGHPEMNGTVVDYQEVRVGTGVSWNVRPLIELNLQAGYMVGRQFDYHYTNVVLNGSGAPYVMVNVHALFKMTGEPLHIDQSNRISYKDLFKYF